MRLAFTLCLLLSAPLARGEEEVASPPVAGAEMGVDVREEPAAASNETETEAPESTQAILTEKAVETTTVGIGNPAIMGCQWPSDFSTRYEFCLKKSQIAYQSPLSEDDLKRGLLDASIMKDLMSNCDKSNLSNCVHTADASKLAAFTKTWAVGEDRNTAFQSCLQENTEAMNRLCGADSEVGRVVSGAAGLQLNLIGALARLHKYSGANLTEACFSKMAETVHITAALYLSSEHFMDNSVLCWNVVNKACDSHCAAFAGQLKCLKAQCPDVPLTIFQEFGIWQWYYLNAKRADQQCKLDDAKCQPIEGTGGPVGGGASSLFDMQKVRAKFGEMTRSLEDTFQLPFHVLLAIAVSAFVAFLASVVMLCLWKYGLLGGKRRKLRYSRLDAGEESRSLTSLPEEMD